MFRAAITMTLLAGALAKGVALGVALAGAAQACRSCRPRRRAAAQESESGEAKA